MSIFPVEARDPLQTHVPWPNVWGEGQLLAFSGMDGPVDFRGQLVFQTASQPGHFHLRLPHDMSVRFNLTAVVTPQRLLADALVLQSSRGDFTFAMADSRTAIGSMPTGTSIEIEGITLGPEPVRLDQTETAQKKVYRLTQTSQAVYALASDTRWAILSWPAEDATGAVAHLTCALNLSIDEVLHARSQWVATHASRYALPSHQSRLLCKTLSAMKVNILTGEGNIPRLWSTPDRWPHRDMWLWDTAFHAVSWAHFEGKVAQEILLAMLEQMRAEDGFMPLCATPHDAPAKVTQPPILAWATEHVFALTGDKAWLRTCLPYLQKYLAWNQQHRDQNGNHLFEWFIDHSPFCRSGESGMDNSPRFDEAIVLDAVDFSAMMAREYEALAILADHLNETSLAAASRQRQKQTTDAIENLLWNPQQRFYCDRDHQNRFTPVLASSGFLPLLTDGPDKHHVDALVEHLENPETFGAKLPVPSVSLNSGAFSKDMWRGPTWININFLIAEGLQRHGRHAQASHIYTRSLQAIEKAYLKTGCIYEYFDALGFTHPADLDRKQRFVHRAGFTPISDYHWTSALAALMLIKQA